ncbi:MAG TPA: hypothetical protein VLJ37_12165 [bacterium]|nr:hypothetical protein [bacterium]
MGGPNDVTQYAQNGRWVLEPQLSLASPGFRSPQVGPSLEFSRRIPFGAKTVELSQLTMDTHWSLDLGVGGRTGGWTDGRPQFFAGTARAGINYNLFNRIGAGLTLRGGYANVARPGDETGHGVMWSGGLRFAAIIDSRFFSAETGYLSMPSSQGEGREGGFYGLVGFGFIL